MQPSTIAMVSHVRLHHTADIIRVCNQHPVPTTFRRFALHFFAQAMGHTYTMAHPQLGQQPGHAAWKASPCLIQLHLRQHYQGTQSLDSSGSSSRRRQAGSVQVIAPCSISGAKSSIGSKRGIAPQLWGSSEVCYEQPCRIADIV